MPRPPNPREFSQINFVVNYALLGCTPPFMLFVEFAKEPAKDLALLLLAPDLQDIGQAIFEPKKGRQRKPARHGRKKPRGFKFPDTSEMIGQRMRGVINPADAIRYTPLKYFFPIVNVIEFVQITAAILEGVTGIFFEGLLGVITVDKNNCKQMGRLVREVRGPWQGGGAGAPLFPVAHDIPITAQGMATTPFGGFSFSGDCVVVSTLTAVALNPEPDCFLEPGLGDASGQVRYRGPRIEFPDSSPKTWSIAGDFENNEFFTWGIADRFGFFNFISGRVFAYTVADLPWN